ncbi:MAG: hypothetical protein LBD57_00265 [Endomicrobium sp.]|uniref:hypothetical protein n=1 Tax=Candidatus Endomicrobiellum cubanum TaxID=3242325 RepID=UPI00281CA9C5|nr:hypothetical protein [Endomicrobium sp.]
MKYIYVVISLFCFAQCFAGQNIDVVVEVTTDVAGNGNASNNGIRPFDRAPIGNTITISSSVTRSVYGSYATGANVEVSSNIVNMTQLANIGAEVYGGRASTGTVSSNVVNVNFAVPVPIYGAYIDNNGSCVNNIVNLNVPNGNIYGAYGCQICKEAEGNVAYNIVNINIGNGDSGTIYGAYISTASAQTVIAYNKVIIQISSGNMWEGLGAQIENGECKFEGNEVIVDVNGTISGDICGVQAANSGANAYNNSVIINNGILADAVNVYGASIDYNGDVVGNSIIINNGTFRHMIIGGITGRALYRAGTGNAINNTVTINNGVVIHGMGGGFSIIGGSSGGGNSTGNKIIINGGTIAADRIFAAESDVGNAVNNTVTIQGNADVDADLLCGGFVWSNPNADMFTGNTLNLDITGVMANGLDHFETYNFYLQENSSNTPLITVRKGGSVIPEGGGVPKLLAEQLILKILI